MENVLSHVMYHAPFGCLHVSSELRSKKGCRNAQKISLSVLPGVLRRQGPLRLTPMLTTERYALTFQCYALFYHTAALLVNYYDERARVLRATQSSMHCWCAR